MRTPRNSICPCGSGLKHKRCCGHAVAIQAAAERKAQERRIAYAEKLAKERKEDEQLAREGKPSPRISARGMFAVTAMLAASLGGRR